jgi:hypothetical protein
MTRRTWTIASYGLALLILLGLGVVNLGRDMLPSWYAAALGSPWEQLPPAVRSIILSYIKLTGAGQIGVSLALGMILAVPFRRGEVWSTRTIAAVGCLFSLLTTYAMLTVQQQTGVAMPWYNPLIGFALFVAGYLLSPRR